MIISFINAKTSGKTTLLANFAVAFANQVPNEKVALVDLNFETPEIAHYFNLIDEQEGIYPIFLDEIFRYLHSGENFEIDDVLTPVKGIPNLSLICGPRDMAEDFSRLQEVHWNYLIRKLRGFDHVLVDTPRYKNYPLFKALLNASEKIVVIQDQDLFGAYHTGRMFMHMPTNFQEKMELWLSRYEETSPIKAEFIEENIGMTIQYRIPGIPRKQYNFTILRDKPFGQDEIPHYTQSLRDIASIILGQKDDERTKRSWKLWTLRKKSENTSTKKSQISSTAR